MHHSKTSFVIPRQKTIPMVVQKKNENKQKKQTTPMTAGILPATFGGVGTPK